MDIFSEKSYDKVLSYKVFYLSIYDEETVTYQADFSLAVGSHDNPSVGRSINACVLQYLHN